MLYVVNENKKIVDLEEYARQNIVVMETSSFTKNNVPGEIVSR